MSKKETNELNGIALFNFGILVTTFEQNKAISENKDDIIPGFQDI